MTPDAMALAACAADVETSSAPASPLGMTPEIECTHSVATENPASFAGDGSQRAAAGPPASPDANGSAIVAASVGCSDCPYAEQSRIAWEPRGMSPDTMHTGADGGSGEGPSRLGDPLGLAPENSSATALGSTHAARCEEHGRRTMTRARQARRRPSAPHPAGQTPIATEIPATELLSPAHGAGHAPRDSHLLPAPTPPERARPSGADGGPVAVLMTARAGSSSMHIGRGERHGQPESGERGMESAMTAAPPAIMDMAAEPGAEEQQQWAAQNADAAPPTSGDVFDSQASAASGGGVSTWFELFPTGKTDLPTKPGSHLKRGALGWVRRTLAANGYNDVSLK